MRRMSPVVVMFTLLIPLFLLGCGGGGGGGGGGSPVAATPPATEKTAAFDDRIKGTSGNMMNLKAVFTEKRLPSSVRSSIAGAVPTYDPQTGIWTVTVINKFTGNTATIYARFYIGTDKTWGTGTLQGDIDDQTTKIEFVYNESSVMNGDIINTESLGHIIKTAPGRYLYNETAEAKVNGSVVATGQANEIILTDAGQYPESGSLTIGVVGEGSATCVFNGSNTLPVKVIRITGDIENYSLAL